MSCLTVIQAVINGLAMLITLFLFGSPLPTLEVIELSGTVEQFSPNLYLATLLNCLLLIIYGLSPHNREMIIIYGFGAVIDFLFFIKFFYYSPRNLRIKIVAVFVAEAVAILIGGFSPPKRIFVGILCIFSCVLMYAVPLSTMRTITETRDVKYMPFWVSFFSFFNGILGIIRSLISHDHYILVANFLGILVSIAQLYLYFKYRDEPMLEPHVNAGRAAVDADRAAVDADRATLEFDRAAVEADRAAVEASRAAVDADRAAVDADRLAVDAGRAVVVMDRAAVEADRAALEADRAALEEGKIDVVASRAAVDADRATLEFDKAAVEADRAAVEASRAAVEEGRNDVVASRAAVDADRAIVDADRTAVEAARRAAAVVRRAAAMAARRAAAVDAGEDADDQ